MTPARILLLADCPYVGGTTSHIMSIIDAFDGDDRFEFVLATLPGRREDKTLLDAAAAAGKAIHVLPMAWRFDLRALRRLRRFFSEHSIDAVHTHGYRGLVVAASASRQIAHLHTCHGRMVDEPVKVNLYQWWSLRVMKRLPLVVACSESVRGWLIERGLAKDRIVAVYNSFKPSEQAMSETTPATLGIEQASLAVLYAGRLAKGKGVEHLLDAVAEVPSAAAVIAGKGPLRRALETRASQRGAAARFVGVVRPADALYRLADVVALPSKMEALPMTLIEAAAYGKPALATNVGGIPEIVEDGKTGILCDYAKPDELAAALERLADPETRRAMGERARAVWRERFAPEHMREKLAHCYQRVLTEAAP